MRSLLECKDAAYAMRTATNKYRTTPLRALWQHPPYFRDGSAATLAAVVAYHDRVRSLRLTDAQKHDLVAYFKSLQHGAGFQAHSTLGTPGGGRSPRGRVARSVCPGGTRVIDHGTPGSL